MAGYRGAVEHDARIHLATREIWHGRDWTSSVQDEELQAEGSKLIMNYSFLACTSSDTAELLLFFCRVGLKRHGKRK